MSVQSTIVYYGTESPLQRYKVYTIGNEGTSKEPIHNVVFIHGGAWRDPTNTCHDIDEFVNYWASTNLLHENVHMKIYSIDYRLTSEKGGPFPGSLFDVLNALTMIKEHSAVDELEITLMGHSVGSTFMTQIIEYPIILNSIGMSKSHFSIPKIKTALFMDGIFDIKALLKEYPDYAFFVKEEFGNSMEYVDFCNSVGKLGQIPIGYKAIKNIIILHSDKDELLSLNQPQNFINWLNEGGVMVTDVIYDDFGDHNNVYKNKEVANTLFQKLFTN